MKSLFEIVSSEIIKKRRKLNRLPSDLRTKFNTIWFYEIAPLGEKIRDAILDLDKPFKMELPRGESGCYACQYCDKDCKFPHDFIDSYWELLQMFRPTRGYYHDLRDFIFYRIHTVDTIILMEGSSYRDEYGDQAVIRGYLLPETYRRLQAIIIPLIRPRVTTSMLDIDSLEWIRGYPFLAYGRYKKLLQEPLI